MADGLSAVTVVVDRGMKKISFFMQCAGLCFPVVLVLPQRFFFFLVHLNAAQSTLIAVLSSLLKETRRISQLKSRMSAGTGNAFSCSCRGRKLGWGSCREKYLLKYSEVPLPPALPELRAVFICLLCFMNSVDFSIIIPPVSECEGGE